MADAWEKMEIALCSQAGCLDVTSDEVLIGTHFHQEGWHNWHSKKMNPGETCHCRKCGTVYTIREGMVVKDDDSTPARIQPYEEPAPDSLFEPEF